jgi:hypothetical protein
MGCTPAAAKVSCGEWWGGNTDGNVDSSSAGGNVDSSAGGNMDSSASGSDAAIDDAFDTWISNVSASHHQGASTTVWSGPLTGGAYVVLVLNLADDSPAPFSIDWAEAKVSRLQVP